MVALSGTGQLERTLLLGQAGQSARYGPLRVYLPYEGGSNKPWIRAVVGPGVPIKSVTVDGVRVWELAAIHLLPLAAAMADRYGEIEMRIQVSTAMKCSTSCQEADADTVWKCVCICAGRDHSGKGTYDDWYSVGRFRLERRSQEVHVQHIQIRRGQIPLPENISRAALEHARPTPPTSSPVQSDRPIPPLRLVPPPAAPAAAETSTSDSPKLPPPRLVSEPVPQRDSGRATAAVLPPARPEPPHRVADDSEASRRRGPLAAAVAIVVAIGMGAWLLLSPDRTDAQVDTGGATETVQPEISPPPPSPASEEPAAPRPAPPKVAPPGCFPFQSNC